MAHPKHTQKDFDKLFKHLSGKDFQSKEELESYMNQFLGKKVDDVLPVKSIKEMSASEQADELVYEAYDLSPNDGMLNVQKALKLDPKNSGAFMYLAENETDVNEALISFGKVHDIEREKLGQKFFKKNKGSFWRIYETRLYMKAKAGLAECLYNIGERELAINHYTEMLELNPNDNQGVRYLLSTLLLEENRLEKFENLNNHYSDDASASFAFNNVIFLYKKEGASQKTFRALQKAYNANKFVVNYLLGYKKMPKRLPEYIGFGDENEAVMYKYDSGSLWKDKSLLSWLKESKEKFKKTL